MVEVTVDPFYDIRDATARNLLKIRRRTRLMIYLEILCAVERVKMRYGLARMTRVQYEANVPYDRFKTYINELIRLGLIESKEQLLLTQRGKAYMVEYKRFVSFLEGNANPEAVATL